MNRKNNLHRILSMLLCACLALGMLAGCGSKTESVADAEVKEVAALDVNYLKTMDESAAEAQVLAKTNGGAASGSTVGSNGATLSAEYVMIYNPKIYDEDAAGTASSRSTADVLSTGAISNQIVTGSNRAGELELEPREFTSIMQNDPRLQVDTSDVTRDGVRASSQDPSYKKGDKHEFWHQNASLSSRVKDTFVCEYVGENCYIWTLDGSASSKQAKAIGQEFDKNVYEKDIEAFGEARFTSNGGKINILLYPMDGGICGFFTMADIWSTAELRASGIDPDSKGFNTDHAIININTNLLDEHEDILYSTLAHELQHLICASDAFEYVDTPFMRTWLNEAMSAYAEELVYPGIKVENEENLQFYCSENFKSGQSLYNFDCENDNFLGAYGAVYLFEEYIREKSGNDPLTEIHEFWRTARRSDMDEADAANAAASKSFANEISDSVTYTAEMSSGLSAEEEWLSKLTLNFYLETLGDELADLDNREYGADFADKVRQIMLYTNASPANIEGGGRIVVATQNGKYQVPSDASSGLIYVALDKNFQPTGIYDSTGVALDGGSNAPSGGTSSGNSSSNSGSTSGSASAPQSGGLNSSLDTVTYVPNSKTYGSVTSLAVMMDERLVLAGANYPDGGETEYSSLTDLESSLKKGLSGDIPGFLIVAVEKLENSTIDLLNQYVDGGCVVTVIEPSSPLSGLWQVNVAYSNLGDLSDFNESLAEDSRFAISLANTLVNAIVDVTNGDEEEAWYSISSN